ncbi:hypothetical protein [Methylorubrum podarium]|jgi:hypothetical protein|uniref:hypothetical protein n=1 Tax=Methylorubrum podarium TaxID=200476 RepID=UPI001EE215FE|nr:hypothetical protein [Methylorubrum podarium]GJE71586.1 hypothetical protein CHKEEEPN_3133 [Methylorubrum podarium]
MLSLLKVVRFPEAINDTLALIPAAQPGVGHAKVTEAAKLIASGGLRPGLTDWMPVFVGLLLYDPGRRYVPAASRAMNGLLRAGRSSWAARPGASRKPRRTKLSALATIAASRIPHRSGPAGIVA